MRPRWLPTALPQLAEQAKLLAMAQATPPPASILFIPPQFVGDAVLLLPLLRTLHQALPQTQLTVWVNAAAYPLLAACPYATVQPAPKSTKARWQALKHLKPQAVLLLRPSISDALLARLAGVKQVIGWAWQRLSATRFLKTSVGLTQSLPYPTLKTQRHHIEALFDFLPLLGVDRPIEITPKTHQLELFLPKAPPEIAALKPTGPYVVLHLGAASANKGIEPTKVLAALAFLQAQTVNGHPLQVLACGEANLKPVYEALSAQRVADGDQPLVNLAGQTSLAGFCQLLKQAQLLLCLDSAPVHLAAALEIPAIVAIYGATSVFQWAPWFTGVFEPVSLTLPCKPCVAKTCAHNQCREDITAGHISAGIRRAWQALNA